MDLLQMMDCPFHFALAVVTCMDCLSYMGSMQFGEHKDYLHLVAVHMDYLFVVVAVVGHMD